jgi:hypothetical protein
MELEKVLIDDFRQAFSRHGDAIRMAFESANAAIRSGQTRSVIRQGLRENLPEAARNVVLFCMNSLNDTGNGDAFAEALRKEFGSDEQLAKRVNDLLVHRELAGIVVEWGVDLAVERMGFENYPQSVQTVPYVLPEGDTLMPCLRVSIRNGAGQPLSFSADFDQVLGVVEGIVGGAARGTKLWRDPAISSRLDADLIRVMTRRVENIVKHVGVIHAFVKPSPATEPASPAEPTPGAST